MKELFKNAFSMWFELPYKRTFSVLIESCKLYLLVLVPYLASIITVVLLSILFGENFISGLGSFTVKYFYDGQVLGFIIWRIHLTWFAFCFLVNLNEDLK